MPSLLSVISQYIVGQLEDIKFEIIVCVCPHGQIFRRQCSRWSWNFAL